MRLIVAALSITIAFSGLARGTDFGGSSKNSIVTVDHAVELPGMVLEPGAYLITVHEGTGGLSRAGGLIIMEIWNQDRTQILGTVAAVPDHRVRPSGSDDETVLTYHDAGEDGPQPIQSCYYARDEIGFEFVYSRDRARELAKASDGRVIASADKKGAIVAVTPNGKETAIAAPREMHIAGRRTQ